VGGHAREQEKLSSDMVSVVTRISEASRSRSFFVIVLTMEPTLRPYRLVCTFTRSDVRVQSRGAAETS
jgi:hypothetical protein